MDGPVPPRDSSLRNIIDKLAEFVARNGPEFEMITKQKQHGNPKFEFLYGGEYAGYYQYRVAAEQAFLKQQGSLPPQASHPAHHAMHQQSPAVQHFSTAPPIHLQQQQQSSIPDETNAAATFGGMNQIPPSNHMWNVNPSSGAQQTNSSSLTIGLTGQIEAINMQQNSLREQIHQSESNLSAQHSALMAQQNKQIEEAIEAAQNTQMEKIAEENGISLKEFNTILQPIIESCTKDSISSGKNWILQHSSDSAKNNVVLQYLLKKALVNGSTFQQKLHLIYLVNDILHHCVRKNSHDLKNSLENVVIPMFCSADLIASSDQRAKLTKLLSLWESKAKFFDACVISKLKSPDSSMQEYKTNLQNLHHEIVTKFTQTTKSTLDNYQKQHQIFIQHATQQITQLEQQKQQLEQQRLASVLPNTSMMPPQIQQQPQQQQQQLPQPNKIPALMSQKISMPGADDLDHMKPPGVDDNNYSDNRYQHQQQSQQQKQQQNNVFSVNANFQQSQPQQPQTRTHHNPFASTPSSSVDSIQQSNFFIPDLSKPPPGFMNPIGPIPGATQQISSLQQQFAQLNNITPNANNVAAAAIGDNLNASTASSLAVDLMALNAAIQLVQQQQQQQQHQQHQPPHQLDSLAAADDDDLPPPAPPMYDDVAPPAPPMYDEEPQKPSAPYYDLPAGLMVPLIRLEDYNYKPLDPEEIRIPPTAPQNERLTNALAAFYAPPTHDRPRDTEGWEKLGLYEYYKVKNAAKKQKEDEIQSGAREKSRSPTPIQLDKPKPKKTNKRCYRSKSRSRSRSRSPYRSRSRSPPAVRSSRRNSGRYNRNRSPRRSPQRERGNDRNDRERDSSNSSNRENRAERNNTRRERERSVTPPSFFGSNLAKANEFIEESNKGHQMLMKMGWAGTGTGLGTKSQGIDQPISGGEVRDRKDLYKGVGVNLNDPFENFRKNKGAAFVVRMRARDEKS